MAVAPTPVAAAPDAPDRAQRATFSARATAFFDWIKNTFVAGVNALASNVYANAQDAASSAANAVAQSASATAQAGIATAQAAAATSAAATATTQAGVATTQAASITTAAATSTAKADVATAKAAEATAAAATATAIVLGVSTGYPIIRPSLTLDFANSQIFDPRITFTRASSGTRTNERGLIESLASGVPRIDFDPVTGECRGLLIEEARTNLLTYSEQFDNAAWAKFRSTITANVATAPDGTLTGDKLVEDTTTSNTHGLYSASYTATGVTLTASIYAKAAERSRVRLEIGNFLDGAAVATADLSDGSTSGVGSGTSDYTNVSATCTSVGKGWYRCTLTATKGNTNSTSHVVVYLDNGTTVSYTGNGTSGVYLWGAQLEVGAFPTSYIPSTSASVTRTADSAVMTGTNFSAWYNQSEGTFVCGFDTVEAAATQGNVFEVGDGTWNERMNAFVSSTPTINWVVTDGGVQVVNFSTGSYVVGNVAKVGTTYALNSFAGSLNGGTPGTDTSGTLPTVNALYIGREGAGGASLNGHIRSLRYYPARLTNAQLQTLTQE